MEDMTNDILVEKYIDKPFDYVITVCGGANESCPVFSGKVKIRLHMGYDDPSHAVGTEKFIQHEFERVRDEIKAFVQTLPKSITSTNKG